MAKKNNKNSSLIILGFSVALIGGLTAGVYFERKKQSKQWLQLFKGQLDQMIALKNAGQPVPERIINDLKAKIIEHGGTI